MPRLHLFSLGAPFLLSPGGEQISFRTRKHLALLIRLATEAGTFLSRDYLMDLLWSDVPARRAGHSLTQALMAVREAVGRENILVERSSVALAEGAVATDLQDLDAGDGTIRGQFLDGFEVPDAVPFEHWKEAYRAKLIPRVRDCLVAQMDAGRRIGDFAALERHARVLLELDPLSEDAVRGIMEARAWVGDRSNALTAYERFAAGLMATLTATPSAELARLATLLREGRRPVPRPPAPGQRVERRERRFEPETLIGREQEFARLYDAWLKVRRQEPRIVVLVGEPGVGKTTLANAFVSTCQMEGAVVARAQAYDAERELPFAILAELVRQLTLQRAIGGTDPEALSELTRVAPEVSKAFPGVPKPVEWSADVIPLRLAHSFLKAVEAAAEESPLVLVVDDIHAADNASAAILHMLARKLARTRLLLILTGRRNELRLTAAPSALVSDTTVQAMETLELEPLSSAAAERLVKAAAAQVDGKLRDLPTARVLQAGNGNPLALELLTKEWVVHGESSLLSDLEALNTQPVAHLGIPRAIGAVFERQIPRLDAATRAALDLAAVLGRRMADLGLYEAVGLASAAAGECLSRLKEEGFLREVHGGLEFRNELIRAQAYYAIAGPARQHLHRRVAELLDGRGALESQRSRVEVAWHFFRGGDASRAMAHGIAGAQEMLRTGAPYEAEQILSALLHENLSTQSNAPVKMLLARSLLDQSKAEAALPLLVALVDEPTVSARDMAEVTRMHATALYLSNRADATGQRAAAEKALKAAQQVGDVDLVGRALFEYARSGTEAGDEACVHGAQAMIEQLLADPAAKKVPIFHYASGYCHRFFFDAPAAARALQTAKDLLGNDRNVTEFSFVYNGYGNCKYQLCEFSEAREAYLAGLEVARRIGDDSRASIITGNLCTLSTTLGEYEEAVRFGQESARLGARALNQPILWVSLTALAEANILAGNRQAANECLSRAHNLVTYNHSWWANFEFCCQAASIALLMGNLQLALSEIEAAERAARGRERVVSNGGVFEKLRVFRTAHIDSADAALVMARAAKARFSTRPSLDYLAVLSVGAWVEQRAFGSYSPETEAELRVFDAPTLRGVRAFEQAQGFLS